MNRLIMVNANMIYVCLTIMVGFFLPVMASSNGSLGRAIGSPFTATLGVFLIASILMGFVIVITQQPLLSFEKVAQTDWKMWLGGCIVVMNILTFTIVPQKIGAANMIVLFIAGQIISSVLAEHFGWLGFPIHPVNRQRLVGLVLLIAGVFLVKKY